METTALLGFVLLEVSFIFGILNLSLSHLLDLIVMYDEDFIIEGLVMQLLLGHCRCIMLLVTHKCIAISLKLRLVESDVLQLSERREYVPQIIFGPGGWKVLDIEVVSLF